MMKKMSFIALVCCLLSACNDGASTPTVAELAATWSVEFIGDRPVVDRSPARLTFVADGKLAGNASCNQLSGSYTLTGNTLNIGQVATTKKLCFPALMEQETRFLEALPLIESATIVNGMLSLVGNEGQLIMKASRVAE